MVTKYTPDRGDIVWLDLNPTRGREQRGDRPVLVVSPRIYNAATNLAVICPITSRIKGYPFEVLVTVGKQSSVILTDHVRSLDWSKRRIRRIGSAPATAMLEVQNRLRKLLF